MCKIEIDKIDFKDCIQPLYKQEHNFKFNTETKEVFRDGKLYGYGKYNEENGTLEISLNESK